MSEISKWYSGKNVLVTGATGFVGKCLVAKLLCDCTNIGSIYVMIRSKNGKSFEQRKSDYKNHIVFSRVKEKRPALLDKICIIEGDLNESNLGISNVNRSIISQCVSIIFHSAADVRFDLPIIDAFNSNVKGTKSLLEFAMEFKHIDVS